MRSRAISLLVGGVVMGAVQAQGADKIYELKPSAATVHRGGLIPRHRWRTFASRWSAAAALVARSRKARRTAAAVVCAVTTVPCRYSPGSWRLQAYRRAL